MMANYPISRVTTLCHFCSYNANENEAHFILECPLYKPIRDKFPSLFENVVHMESQIMLSIGPPKLILASISRRLQHSATLEN